MMPKLQFEKLGASEPERPGYEFIAHASATLNHREVLGIYSNSHEMTSDQLLIVLSTFPLSGIRWAVYRKV